MRGCFSSFLLPLPVPDVPTLRFTSPHSRWRLHLIPHTILNVSRRNPLSIGKYATFSSSNSGCRRRSRASDSEGLGFRGELGFKEKLRDDFGFRNVDMDSPVSNEVVTDDATHGSSFGFLNKDEEEEKKRKTTTTGSAKERDLVRLEGDDNFKRTALRGGKQMMKRSNLVPKQVISIQSALSLGFISQLWVDTTSWAVLVVEVKPSLLAGESERFLLKDVARVGDVVLVEDEFVLENDFKMVGLETLVGYRVVTPGRRSIGKVRGYTFNINSGIVDSLELDSFGISVIPRSLVSTYTLHVEDVLEVLSDIVVVEEAAASRIQRLTKGLWDAQHVATFIDEEFERSDRRRRKRRGARSNRSDRRRRDVEEEEDVDWGFPLDFL